MASHLWLCKHCAQYLEGTPQKVLEFAETHVCDDFQINGQMKECIAEISKILRTLFENPNTTVGPAPETCVEKALETENSASVTPIAPPPPPTPPPRAPVRKPTKLARSK